MKLLQYIKERVEPEEAHVEGEGSARASRIPDSEVVERPKRRAFTVEYKLRILREADAREKLEICRLDNNSNRPHSALCGLTLEEYAASHCREAEYVK